MSRLSKLVRKVKEINGMLSHDFDGLQTWQSMHQEWSLYETRNLNGSESTKIFQTDHIMRFFVKIPPTGNFLNHWHDCSEICKVLSGSLADRKSGLIARVNDFLVFSKGQNHDPYNPSQSEPCYLIVEFCK